MSTPRTKKTVPPVPTREEMEACLARLRDLRIHLSSLRAEKDAAVAMIDRQYESSIAGAAAAVSDGFELIKLWADTHPAEFGKARSLALTHGVIGWRAAGPALRTLAGWTFDRVLVALEALKADAYIRVKREVNKQTLLADREEIGPDKLREIGLRVVNEESFFVEPKIEAAL